MDPLWLWQLADATFPTGGFAHSGGLEAAWQIGQVRDLEAFLAEALWNAGRGALPFVGAAHAAPAELGAIDDACDAFLTGEVANRASRAQGRALLRAAEAAFGDRLAGLARAGGPGHLAPTHGAVLGALGASREEAQRLFLFLAARGVLSAAVRLGVAGPLEAQALQARAAGVVEQVLAACGGLPLEEAALENPLLELFQGHQDRLYSRLFQS